jgi:hypothetical protein
MNKDNKIDAKAFLTKQRLCLMVGLIFFIVLFDWAYVNSLSPRYSYLGLSNNSFLIENMIFAYLICFIPGFWMPIEISRPSQFIYWMLYIFVYIPSTIIPVHMMAVSEWEALMLIMTLLVGFYIIGSIYFFPLLSFKCLPLSRTVFWSIVVVLFFVLTLWVCRVFRGNFKLVSFFDVYNLRFKNNNLLQVGGITYAIAILMSFFNPFFMSYGIFRKHYILYALGAVGQIILYMALGMKAALLSTLIIPFFYLCLKYKKSHFGLIIIWCTVFLFLLYGIMDMSGLTERGWGLLLLGVIIVRSFSIPGMLMGLYQSFFTTNPVTFLSHAHGIGSFIKYPYVVSIGEEIGKTYYDSQMNANANFLATDGLGGFGLIGIVFISLLCAFVFWLVDSLANRHDLKFSTLMLIFPAVGLTNGSLFTTLISGGLLLVMVTFYLLPKDGQNPLN